MTDGAGTADGLERFRSAQDGGGTYERALAELAAGRKRSHWMWFVLPQISGLGRSATARHYAIRDVAEARALLADPVLGPRLIEAMRTAAAAPAASAEALLGDIDAVKLRSSATLFGRVAPEEPVFGAVLTRWFGGQEDPATVALL